MRPLTYTIVDNPPYNGFKLIYAYNPGCPPADHLYGLISVADINRLMYCHLGVVEHFKFPPGSSIRSSFLIRYHEEKIITCGFGSPCNYSDVTPQRINKIIDRIINKHKNGEFIPGLYYPAHDLVDGDGPGNDKIREFHREMGEL